jgi:hypothetical protein
VPQVEPQRGSSEINELAAAVKAIDPLDERAMGGALVTALSRLASVVRTTDEAAASKIARATEGIRTQRPDTMLQGEVVKDALSVALDAFARRLENTRTTRARDNYIMARTATEAIADEAPLGDQASEVHGVLRALANLAAVLEGAPAPFGASNGDVRVGYDAARLQARSTEASAAVSALAKERDWKRAGQRASRALVALAAVVEVAPLVVPAPEWRSLVRGIRFHAHELSRRGVLNLDRADQVKAGLTPCVEALRALEANRRTPTAVRLIETATAAVDAIDPDVSFVFQRASIQDAFRLITDGFVLIAESRVYIERSAIRSM